MSNYRKNRSSEGTKIHNRRKSLDSIKKIEENIKSSIHNEKIKNAEFKNITIKSKISIFLMKKNLYKTAFYFLNFTKKIKNLIKRVKK